jgi:hypothetical protein
MAFCRTDGNSESAAKAAPKARGKASANFECKPVSAGACSRSSTAPECLGLRELVATLVTLALRCDVDGMDAAEVQGRAPGRRAATDRNGIGSYVARAVMQSGPFGDGGTRRRARHHGTARTP